jgi:hypothetical protein
MCKQRKAEYQRERLARRRTDKVTAHQVADKMLERGKYRIGEGPWMPYDATPTIRVTQTSTFASLADAYKATETALTDLYAAYPDLEPAA